MSRRPGRSRLIGLLVFGPVAIAPVAGAQASDASLQAIVKRDLPAIKRSQARITAGQAALKKTHSIAELIKAVRAQDVNLTRLEAGVQGASSSSSIGARGKVDVVQGLKLIITSNRGLIKDIEKESVGTPVSKARLSTLVRDDRRGSALFGAGARLLRA